MRNEKASKSVLPLQFPNPGGVTYGKHKKEGISRKAKDSGVVRPTLKNVLMVGRMTLYKWQGKRKIYSLTQADIKYLLLLYKSETVLLAL